MKNYDSYFNGKHVIIPLDGVQHVEKYYHIHPDPDNPGKLKPNYDDFDYAIVVMKTTKWDFQNKCWNGAIYLKKSEFERFYFIYLNYLEHTT